MIRITNKNDINTVYEIMNDAAVAYKGIIPKDRWHEPYMPLDELLAQIKEGVVFWCYEENNEILGVMGIQDKTDVDLIRHAYVKTVHRKKGIGGKLLKHLYSNTTKPMLIGTWKAATWAIRFYEKHEFTKVDTAEKNRLLKKYWSIPERQIETSVVLVDKKWLEKK